MIIFRTYVCLLFYKMVTIPAKSIIRRYLCVFSALPSPGRWGNVFQWTSQIDHSRFLVVLYGVESVNTCRVSCLLIKLLLNPLALARYTRGLAVIRFELNNSLYRCSAVKTHSENGIWDRHLNGKHENYPKNGWRKTYDKFLGFSVSNYFISAWYEVLYVASHLSDQRERWEH